MFAAFYYRNARNVTSRWNVTSFETSNNGATCRLQTPYRFTVEICSANAIGTNNVRYNCAAIAPRERTCSSPDLTMSRGSRRRWWKHVRARYENLHKRLDAFEKRGNIVHSSLSLSLSLSLSFSLLPWFFTLLSTFCRERAAFALQRWNDRELF